MSSKPYVIAIPTYKRHLLISSKTLAILERHHIEASRIYLFVADKLEEELYRVNVPSHLYGHIIVGVPGLHHQRNFISSYFPEGQRIVEFDDDLTEIYELQNARHRSRRRKPATISSSIKRTAATLKPISNLHQFLLDAFEYLVTHQLFLFGVYPIDNPYFMTVAPITTDLRFIVGPFWGFINRRDQLDLMLTISEKEDSERTLQFYTRDGGVLRFNRITFRTNYYTTPGGMQAEGLDRKHASAAAAEYLHSKYPDITRISKTKKTGITELVMLRRGHNKTQHFTPSSV